MKELIIIKQLPVIEQHFKELSKEIDEKVAHVNSLAVTEDTVKDVKKIRAEMNKEYKALEAKRIDVKNKINAPYMDFEKMYKEYAGDKYKKADADLKAKIAEIENGVKKAKEDEARAYFSEQDIDFVKFEQVGLNVTLSVTVKALKEHIDAFISRINDDLKLIETQEHEAEILVEYKRTLNCSQAITSVVERYRAIEEEKERQEKRKRAAEEARKQAKERRKAQEELRKAQAEEAKANEEQQKYFEATDTELSLGEEEPPVEEERIVEEPPKELTITFKVTASIQKLRALKQYLIEEGIDFEDA